MAPSLVGLSAGGRAYVRFPWAPWAVWEGPMVTHGDNGNPRRPMGRHRGPWAQERPAGPMELRAPHGVRLPLAPRVATAGVVSPSPTRWVHEANMNHHGPASLPMGV